MPSAVKSPTKWVKFSKFTGFQTKFDASKVDDGANVNGQNTTINDGDRISIRNWGYERFPTDFVGINTPGTSMHTFRRRDGVSILMKAYGTNMAYYNPLSAQWEIIKSDYTANKKFGFADYTLHTDTSSKTYFGNAVDSWSYWTGNYTNLTAPVGIGDGTLNVTDTTGFANTGIVSIAGVEYAYSSKTPTTFVLSGTTSAVAATGAGVSDSIVTDNAKPKGNIYMIANNRLFISGVLTSPQATYFSAYGAPTDFSSSSLVTGSTGTASGTFNFAEGGGAVIGCSQDESSSYWFKKSIIYKVTLSDTLYSLTALKPFDGKSQTSGAVSARSIFTGGNGAFFVTPDNQIIGLQRIAQLDYPQNAAISDLIKNTVRSINFDDSVGIVFQDKAYFASRAFSSANNNAILVWNISLQAWDSPILGANVADMAVYNDGNGDRLYFLSNVSNDVYKVNTTPLDDIYGVTANWRSKQFTFGEPQLQKIINNYFIEGYISDNTTLTITLLFDDNGVSGQRVITISAVDGSLKFNNTVYNAFGLTAFGAQRFGANDDASTRIKFRVYPKNGLRVIPFYNLQIDFASDGENQQWEVIEFAFKVGIHDDDENRKLYK